MPSLFNVILTLIFIICKLKFTLFLSLKHGLKLNFIITLLNFKDTVHLEMTGYISKVMELQPIWNIIYLSSDGVRPCWLEFMFLDVKSERNTYPYQCMLQSTSPGLPSRIWTCTAGTLGFLCHVFLILETSILTYLGLVPMTVGTWTIVDV